MGAKTEYGVMVWRGKLAELPSQHIAPRRVVGTDWLCAGRIQFVLSDQEFYFAKAWILVVWVAVRRDQDRSKMQCNTFKGD